MSETAVPAHGWQPRADQLKLWSYLEDGGKRAVEIAHRRWGKDDVALHWTAVAAHRRVGTYWHLLPEAAQARKAIFEAVNPRTGRRRIDDAFPKGLREATRETDMMLKLKCGSTWQVVGSDNFDSLVGSPPVGIVFSEWALADPRAWPFLRPILEENNGWALFVTTPRGRNHAVKTLELARSEPGWFAQVLPATETPVFDATQLDRIKREMIAEMGEDDGATLFEQEYMCSFESAIVGSYYGSLMAQAEKEGRIRSVPWEPRVPVETWWDLGVRDSTSIWFVQRVGLEVRLIDYYEASGEGLAHYAKVLREKPYVYGRHLAPHDIEVRELSADGKSRREVAAGLGIRFETVPAHSIEDGIQAVRDILPRCFWDRDKTKRGADAMVEYRKTYNDKLKAFSSTPLHNWASNAADAFRTGAAAGKPARVDYKKLDPFSGPRPNERGPNSQTWLGS